MNKTIEDLNRLYDDGVEADQRVWSEMRSNIQLVAGEHYTKKGAAWNDRIRASTDIPEDTKLRLTRNHIQRLSKIYINTITSLAPGAAFKPNNSKEAKDIKSAQLHQAVWDFHKHNHKLRTKTIEWAGDFVNFGEVWVKMYWDYTKGVFKGYKKKPVLSDPEDPESDPQIDPNTGQMAMEDDTSQPIWTGDIVFERVYAFNMFRPKASQSMHDAEWLGIRKMAMKKELEEIFKDDDEKLGYLNGDSNTTYFVFDANRGQYEMSKDQIMLREVYYRPCSLYPNGYYYIYTQAGILWEGELPFGIFPIVGEGFDKIPTTPRALSPIKTWKPFQIEINRVASKMAEHQITLGDDKIVVGSNGKISSAGTAPGIRAYSVSSPNPPTILAGRTGDQYLPYLEKTIGELYMTAMVSEMLEEKQAAQVDPYAMLLQVARQKQKFSIYSESFGEFLKTVAFTAMELTRKYISDDTFIQMAGASEQVNISEFKNSAPMCYQVEVEEQSDDLESKMGRQLTLNHIIQYAGQNMDKKDLGKLFTLLPYVNSEEIMSDMTLEYDVTTNMILELQRGSMPTVDPNITPTYVIQRLAKRMSEPDFRYLPQQIQQMFAAFKQQYMQVQQQQLLAMQRAESGYIPTDGYMVTVQVYAPDPKTGAQKLIKVPYSSVIWLVKQLEAQGLSQDALQMLNKGDQAQLAMMTTNAPQAPQGSPGALPRIQ